MLSFYQKLAAQLNNTNKPTELPKEAAPSKSVSYNANGEKTAPAKSEEHSDAPPANEPLPEGTEPIDVDLFESESRMIVFVPLEGVPASDLSVTVSEETNTLLIEATQKRPNAPPPKGAKEGTELEKGRFVKQEIKWKSLYRKVYLPTPFDAGEAEAVFERGVLIIILPVKHPGTGKKLAVREVISTERPS